MRVLYLHQYFVPPDGSGGTRSYEMARRFVQAGHKVLLITSTASFPDSYSLKKTRNILEIEGIELRILKVAYSNKMTFVGRMLSFVKFVFMASVESIRTSNVDVVFASSTPLTIALPGLVAKLAHRCPMVFEVRDLWPEVPFALGVLKNPFLKKCAKWLECFAYQNSSHVIALSPGMKDGVVSTGFPAEKVTIVPNSSDIELFRGESVSGNRFRALYSDIPVGRWVVYAGTIGKVNGIDYLVEIAAEMKNKDSSVQFLIVGDGKFKSHVTSLAKKLDVFNKNFWLVPPVPKSQLPDVLAAATVATSFVIDVPALWHNSANKFFDSFAAKKPIVINHEGWQADFLRGSGAGLVIPPHDARKAAELIFEFLNNKERLNLASEAAAKAADDEFNRDRLAGELRLVLEKAVNEK